MNIEIKLKPCPFCGGEAEIIDDAMGTISRCRRCGAENGNGVYGEGGHKLAAKDWNSRPIEEDLNEQIRRFKKYAEALENEIKELREALTFYAKGEHSGLEDWQIEQILKNDDVFAESYVETGKRAREALKADKDSH